MIKGTGGKRGIRQQSDAVNDLIRKARAEQEKIEAIRSKLIEAEQSGSITPDRETILAGFKAKLSRNG